MERSNSPQDDQAEQSNSAKPPARRARVAKKKQLPALEVSQALTVSEAYRMRCEGYEYVEIAKALKIKGGWVEAHRLISEHYGELVAGIDKARLRESEAGRLMAIRDSIESAVMKGEKWAIQSDLAISQQIADLMALSDKGQGGSATAAVQVNITPPWDVRDVRADIATPADITVE